MQRKTSFLVIIALATLTLATLASKSAEATTNANTSESKPKKPASAKQKDKAKSNDPMQTFRWAFNPAIGCGEQSHTPAEIVAQKKECKASAIPNPSAKLILVKCAITNGETTVGSLDYVFVKSEDMCLQLRDLASSTQSQ